MSIPKIIHYVWVGPKPLPEEAERFILGWRALMPDYQIMRWDEGNIDFSPSFIRQAYGVRAYNRVANYARLAALRDHGGFYLDHDIELLKPLDSLRQDECLVGFQTLKPDARDVVNNAVIGAAPNHPFVRNALAAMDALDGGMDLGSRTGPGLLSKLLRESGPVTPGQTPIVHGGVTLYPPRFFYPYEWQSDFTPDCITPDTIAVHHWDHTWRGKPGIRARVRKALLRRLTLLSPALSVSFARWSNARARGRLTRSTTAARGAV